MTTIVFSKKGLQRFNGLPNALLYALWTYAYQDGKWHWVDYHPNGHRDWKVIGDGCVPKEFKAQALLLG